MRSQKKSLKMLCSAALVSLIVTTFAGASSAMAETTALCKADESPCAGGNVVTHIHETTLAGSPSILLNSVGNITCDVLFLGDTVASTYKSLVIKGNFTYSNCLMGSTKCTVTEKNGPAEVKVFKEGHETAKLTFEYEINFKCGAFIKCTYDGEGLAGTGKGPLLSSETNGSDLLDNQTTNKILGFLCPAIAELDITTTPLSTTYVEVAPKVYWGAWLGGNAYSTGEKTYGDGPWDSETWNLFEKHTGKKISIEHFGQPAPWNQAFAEGPLNLTRERGAIPMMDMDPDGVTLKEIVEGKKDSDFKTWAKAVKAWGYPMFFRWTWEMNGTWFQWGKEAAANPTLYKEAWWHLHDIVEEQGASNVTWVWCPNLTFSGSTSLSSLYPAKESEGKGKYVDWTCLDGYNFGTNPKKSDSWKSFSTLYTSSYNELLALAPTKPIMIGEMSSTEYGGSKASWITDAIGTQIPENFPKIKAVVWYNKWDGELDWPIETSASSESAFASAIASTYYAGNTFGSLSALTKVEPLP